MSEPNDDPGPLPDELRAFMDRHRRTGEPTGAELGRALLKVHLATRPFSPFSVRRWVPPEALAVAALFVLTIGGAALGAWVRERRAAQASDAVARAREAWVKGDLDAAAAAFDGCDTDECLRLARAVKKAREQRGQLDALDGAEAGSLLSLDEELSAGGPSALSRALESGEVVEKNPALFLAAQRRALARQGVDERTIDQAVAAFERGLHLAGSAPGDAMESFAEVARLVPASGLARTASRQIELLVKRAEAPPAVTALGKEAVTSDRDRVDVAALLERGKLARKERRYDDAVANLTQCLSFSPDEPHCVLTLASTLAQRGGERNNPGDTARARALYERFLVIAAKDDHRRSRVQEILADPPSAPQREVLSGVERAQRTGQIRELYLRGYQLRESSPDEARAAFEQVLTLAEPGSVDYEKASSRLRELNSEPTILQVRSGARHILSVPGLARLAVGDTAVADVETKGDHEIEVTGLEPGQTTLLAWSTEGTRRSWVIEVKGRPLGRLRIASNPTRARIFLDGRDTGRTTPVLPANPLLVPPGRHRLQFELDGRRSKVVELDVVEGDNPVVKGDIPL